MSVVFVSTGSVRDRGGHPTLFRDVATGLGKDGENSALIQIYICIYTDQVDPTMNKEIILQTVLTVTQVLGS